MLVTTTSKTRSVPVVLEVLVVLLEPEDVEVVSVVPVDDAVLAVVDVLDAVVASVVVASVVVVVSAWAGTAHVASSRRMATKAEWNGLRMVG